jgi:hypothetical protein
MENKEQVKELETEISKFKNFVEMLKSERTRYRMVNDTEDGREALEYYDQAIKQASSHLNGLVGELGRFVSCPEFAYRFGVDLHEYYREKYPINKETRLVDTGLHYQARTWQYPISTQSRITRPSDVATWSMTPTFKTIDFELIGNNKSRIWLAYAPEINTVFIGKTEQR